MNDAKVIHRIGLKYGLSDWEVEEIIKISYKFVKDTIEAGDLETCEFKNVKMPGLGIFCVNGKIKKAKDGNYKVKTWNTDK